MSQDDPPHIPSAARISDENNDANLPDQSANQLPWNLRRKLVRNQRGDADRLEEIQAILDAHSKFLDEV